MTQTYKSSMNSHHVVVIGNDPHLINACVARGITGVVIRDVAGHLRVDNDVSAGFDEVVVGDLTDIGEVMGGFLRAPKVSGRAVDAVVTMNEFAIGTAAGLAVAIGAKSISLDLAVNMRDKHAQKEIIRIAGLPVANSRYCVPGSSIYSVPFPGPCVVKPLAGAGTENTYRCVNADEYEVALRAAHTTGSPLIVEDLVEVDEEWLYDGVVKNGEVVFGALGRYSEPLLDLIDSGQLGQGDRTICTYRIDDSVDPDGCSEARKLARASLDALQYANGAFHMELFREKGTGRFIFGECAARRGGSMIEEEILAKFGYSISGGAIDALLEREAMEPTRHDSAWFGTTFIYLPAGTLVDVATPKDLLELDFVHAAHVSALIGPIGHPAAMSTAWRHAMCVVSGSTFEEMQKNMTTARQHFAERCVIAPTEGPRAELQQFAIDWRARISRN